MEKKSIVASNTGVHQILKHTETDGKQHLGLVLVPSISTGFRAVPAPGQTSTRLRMVVAFTELNSGGN